MLSIRRSLVASLWSLAMVASVAASAQSQPTLANSEPVRYTDTQQFYGNVNRCARATANLNGLPDGATTIAFQMCPDAYTGYAVPFANATLTGGTVTGGQIVSSTPIVFSFGFDYRTQQPGGFGAEFRVLSGTDTIFLAFLRGGTVLRSAYGRVGESAQFLGEKMPVGILAMDQVRISALGGSTFAVDNLHLMAPEPGTWALLGTGLMAIGGIAVRRRHAS